MADPRELVDELTASKEKLAGILDRWNYSKGIRETTIEPQATKYAKVMKGISIQDKSNISKTTKRTKLYFRKVSSAVTRIVASFYQAFLKDRNKLKVFGSDDQNDFEKAKVLEAMGVYRLKRFFRRDNGYVKIINGLQESISPGFAATKVTWQYFEDEDGNVVVDKPDMINYPLEHLCLDWSAGTIDKMRYVYLENYLSKDEMEELGYINIDKMVEIKIPDSALRQVRFRSGATDPQNALGGSGNYTSGPGGIASGTVGMHYPKAGQDPNEQPPQFIKRYRIVECWYKKNGKVEFAAVNPEGGVWAEKPIENPHGSVIPIAFGSMLLEPHKLVPESIIDAVIGPQESLNMGLNLRKENQMLAMQGGFLYDRAAGVNKSEFRNIYPGWSAGTDNINGVTQFKFPDVTQTSYAETNADSIMIEEQMGVNDTIQGQSKTGKTGEAQINAALAQVKLDFFIANVSQTYFQQLMYLWIYNIQLFETDEIVFRVANSQLRSQGIDPKNRIGIYDLEFDMDVEVEVGMTEIGRAQRFNQMTAIIQNMNQSNQASIGMLTAGIQPQKPIKLWDVSEVFSEYLPDLGINNPNRFLYTVIPPPPEQKGDGKSTQGAQGNVPQVNQENAEAGATDEAAFNQALQENGIQ